MPVPIVNVVSVVLVRDGYVAALQAVLVGMALVRDVPALQALVGVVAVNPVEVAVVRVIGVIAVRERDVPAAVTMVMLVTGVSGVLSHVRHRGGPSCAGLISYKDINI
jgi:hypothetical protein